MTRPDSANKYHIYNRYGVRMYMHVCVIRCLYGQELMSRSGEGA